MRHLRSISILLVVVGAASVAATFLFDLDPVLALGGLLLAWAGIVKAVIIYLWRDLVRPNRASSLAGDRE